MSRKLHFYIYSHTFFFMLFLWSCAFFLFFFLLCKMLHSSCSHPCKVKSSLLLSLQDLSVLQSEVCILVFSVTDRRSFHRTAQLRLLLRETQPQTPIILVGNKSDLVRTREVTSQGEGESSCHPHHATLLFPVWFVPSRTFCSHSWWWDFLHFKWQ